MDWSFNELIVPATRYYIGRMTGATTEHAEKLASYWPYLDEETKEVIKKDLTEAFKRDDRLRSLGKVDVLPLGQDCDREAWEKVRAAWNK